MGEAPHPGARLYNARSDRAEVATPADDIPFTTFRGHLKQIDSAGLPSIFDLFFPKFRTEEEWRSRTTGGANIAFSTHTTSFIGRGRERRFAGDRSLPRGRYYCLIDSDTNKPSNNTLIGELFAYADPVLPFMPELVDSQVEVEQVSAIAKAFDWGSSTPCLVHIIRSGDDPWVFPWVFSPVFGIRPQLFLLKYPINVIEMEIDRVVDLRLPDTLDWLARTFVQIERDTLIEGEVITTKGSPPENLREFLPLLLSQELGGGSTFIQGIGAWLRSRGASAIIYPSARSDSRTVVREGAVVESFGYILLDYRGASVPEFNPNKFFGALASWRERDTASFAIDEGRSPGEFRLDIRGVRALQECRFAMFHDWITQTIDRIKTRLHEKTEELADKVTMVVRKPADVLGSWAEEILGPSMTFIIEEGGGFMPISGFLTKWRSMDNARFIASALPLARSDDNWESEWWWDENNWFLSRRCLRRPWAVIKCPVCYFEQFWDLIRGDPERSCVRCGFTRNNDVIHMEIWHKRLNETPSIRPPQENTERSRLLQENQAIYSAVCERHRDAVSGEKCATQEEAILRTLP